MNAKQHLSREFNPSLETLVAKYLEYRNRVESCEESEGKSGADHEALLFCREKLAEVEAALFPPPPGRKKISAAWQLLHRVGEELILTMGRDELSAYALRLGVEIRLSRLPDSQKDDWSTRIAQTAEKLSEAGCTAGELSKARHQFKNMHRAVNAIVDDSFWDLWVKKLLALCYSLLLIMATSWFLFGTGSSACLTPLKILLLGAMGGLLSGLLTGEPETIPKGHFWMPVLYYILTRPALGALTALITFWMLESQFLIRIDPPLPQEVRGFSCNSSAGVRPADPLKVAGSHGRAAKTVPQPPEEQTKREKGSVEAMVTLQAREGKQSYLYLVVLLFAGFSGDKLLKTVADRVTAKLIAQAEKTREAK